MFDIKGSFVKVARRLNHFKLSRLVAVLVSSLLLVGLLAACGDATATPTTIPATASNSSTTAVTSNPATTTTTITTIAPTTAASTTVPATTAPAATTIPVGSFQNPVLDADFPDPYVMKANNLFYAYATNAGGKKIQVTSSTDLVNWKTPAEALPVLPPWATVNSTLVWAPEVAFINGHYNLYFTARDFTSDKQCVGVATGDQPTNFSSASTAPLVCHPADGGDIDQDIFQDSDGKLYLYFKNDGNCCGLPTHIFVQPLTPDGLNVTGEPTQLLTNTVAWEGRVIEAPSMFKHDGKYYLFFSGNNYADATYAVGYATCTTALGPCQQAAEDPILKSVTGGASPVIGPGHQALLEVGEQTWIFYHVWEATAAGQGDRRLLWMDQLNWVNDKPVVHGPTSSPQADPIITP